MTEIKADQAKFEVVPSFCYLGDTLSAGGGCDLATITRVQTAWKKFRELMPVLTSRHISLTTRGRLYSSCIRSTMLHASETWPLTTPSLQRLLRNDKAMIRQVCNTRAEDLANVSNKSLLTKLGLVDLSLILRERRLRWLGHVERSNGAIRLAFDMEVSSRLRKQGRPKTTWKGLTARDRAEWNIRVDTSDRDAWRTSVRSAMRAASQISGAETPVDASPTTAR